MTSKPVLFALGLLTIASAARAAEIKELSNVRDKWWEIRADYPVFSGSSALAKAINADAKKYATTGFEQFLKDARADMPEIKKMGMSNTYDYSSTVTLGTQHKDLLTCYWTTYSYTAGAHGSVWYETMNYGMVNGKAKKLKLKDLFYQKVDAYEQASLAVHQELRKDERYDYLWEYQMGEIDPALLENFVVTPKGITFLFGHYALTAYAGGTFEVEVPFKELLGLNPAGPLKPVLSGKGAQ